MKKIYFILAFTLTIFLFTIGISATDIQVVDKLGNTYNHDSYNFYLPSHISPSEVSFKIVEGSTLSYTKNGTEIEIKEGDVVDFLEFHTTTTAGPAYLVNIKIDGYEHFMFLRFANNLPSINITTSIDPENIIAYSQQDTAVKTIVISNDGTLLHRDVSNTGELRIRGNATEAYAKKPFQVKLASKANLFGMGSDKTWLLLANYDDQSLIRNNIMYTIGKELGIDTCDFQNVDLFINGEYYGIYLLCEKVEIDKNRVNISDLEEENDKLNPSYTWYSTSITSGTLIDSTILTEYRYISNVTNPENITGGYLVELDNNYYKNELCYFSTENGNHYVIKSPEYASQAEVEYIAKLFADMEEAIMSESGYNRNGKHYTEYVDIDTLASAYILQEFGRNYDAGSSSLYFYKEKDITGNFSKIVKGPLWDCDNTLGNIHKNDASSTEGLWAANRSIWKGLTKKADFMALVKEKYEKVYDTIFDMIDRGGYIDGQVLDIGDSIYMEQRRWGSNNYETWPLYYDGTHYDRWQSAPVFNFLEVYSSGLNEDSTSVIGYLCEHIEARANWLANEWCAEVTLRERSFVLPEPPQDEPNEGEDPSTEPEDPTPEQNPTVPDSGENIPNPPSDDDGEETFPEKPNDGDKEEPLPEQPNDSEVDEGATPTPDMTPDLEEPPAIDEAPKEKSFFEKLWELIVWVFQMILSLFK